MLFNSFQFLIFYLIVVVVTFALPHRWRWLFLLLASYYFYMCWNPAYIVIIWAITLLDFSVGILIENTPNRAKRRWLLLLSLLSNFGILLVFKYSNFLLGSVRDALQVFHIFAEAPQLAWLLPVGISFHTFQGVSYTIDVYRGNVRAERKLKYYALFIAFFPQMVAGPIERANRLLPQLRAGTRFEHGRLRSGLELVLWGLFKKVVIADSLAALVNQVYSTPQRYPGVLLALATVCFAIQIYCDFSGYSDMAVGLARIMGYDLMINFRRPLFADSIAEYWRRWHISLFSWFRDYVYIPLGGNREKRPLWIRNVMIVFLLSGLWHGASWTFVVWGGIHGIYVVTGRALAPIRQTLAAWSGVARFPALHRLLRTAITGFLVCFAFIFFRANSLRDAAYIASHFYRLDNFHFQDLLTVGLPAFELQIAALAVLTLFVTEFIQGHPGFLKWWHMRQLRWPVYCACFYSVVFFGVFDRIEFIYFQF